MSLKSQIEAMNQIQSRLSENSFARSHVNRLTTAGRALDQIASAKAGAHPADHARKVTQASQRYLQAVTDTKASITQSEVGGLGALMDEFKQRVGFTTDRYANDIAQAFRADPEKRMQWLGQIVAEGDGRSLAALFEAPEFVHGLDRETLNRFREAMEERHAPDVFEKRQVFQEDLNTARVALQTAENLAQEALKVDNAEQALRDAEASKQAEADFNAAVGGE